jgi:hypothetical protein
VALASLPRRWVRELDSGACDRGGTVTACRSCSSSAASLSTTLPRAPSAAARHSAPVVVELALDTDSCPSSPLDGARQQRSGRLMVASPSLSNNRGEGAHEVGGWRRTASGSVAEAPPSDWISSARRHGAILIFGHDTMRTSPSSPPLHRPSLRWISLFRSSAVELPRLPPSGCWSARV